MRVQRSAGGTLGVVLAVIALGAIVTFTVAGLVTVHSSFSLHNMTRKLAQRRAESAGAPAAAPARTAISITSNST